MRRIAISLSAVLICVAAMATAVPLGAAAPGAASRAKGNVDVTKLFPEAVELVRSAKRGKLARAVMLEAEGLPEGAAAEDAKDIVHWRFVLDNQKTKGSKFLSAYVDYTVGEGFGKVNGVKQPFVEDRRMKQPPEMTFKKAVTALRDAGYADPFLSVVLRRPVLQERTPALYIFEFEGDAYIAVNTKSGAVAPF
jgi:hypothetical protein